MTNPNHIRFVAPPAPLQVVTKTLKYGAADEHVLRRIAGAIVLHWDQLPDALQDLLIDQAAVVDDREDSPHAAEDIARFIRDAKTAPVAKPASA